MTLSKPCHLDRSTATPCAVERPLYFAPTPCHLDRSTAQPCAVERPASLPQPPPQPLSSRPKHFATRRAQWRDPHSSLPLGSEESAPGARLSFSEKLHNDRRESRPKEVNKLAVP